MATAMAGKGRLEIAKLRCGSLKGEVCQGSLRRDGAREGHASGSVSEHLKIASLGAWARSLSGAAVTDSSWLPERNGSNDSPTQEKSTVSRLLWSKRPAPTSAQWNMCRHTQI